jgi:hypothetical protein
MLARVGTYPRPRVKGPAGPRTVTGPGGSRLGLFHRRQSTQVYLYPYPPLFLSHIPHNLIYIHQFTMVANGNSNGDSTSGRVLKSGVWAPIPTFFDDSEELGMSFCLPVVPLKLADTTRCQAIQGACSQACQDWYAACRLWIYGRGVPLVSR